MVGYEVVSCFIDKRNKVFYLYDEFWQFRVKYGFSNQFICIMNLYSKFSFIFLIFRLYYECIGYKELLLL